jgi:hypothetical protein
MTFERIFEMPRKYTFEQPKLRAWILSYCQGRVLNVFGGTTILEKDGCEFVTNDMNPDIPAAFHFDATELAQHLPEHSFDTILLDPPYTMFQAVHSYHGVMCQDITAVRNTTDRLLKPNGVVISLGYNTTGMSAKRGYEKLAILICNNGGSHNDILTLVEQKS